jgi:mono/diheme cytochrome c family protein
MMNQLNRTFAAAIALMLVQTASASAQDVRVDLNPSADEFRNSCASCHGVDGKGSGFLTTLFKGIDPGDLTQLAKNNGGIFPFNRVLAVIDGRVDVAAHGHRDMPVWGDRYMREYVSEYGPDRGGERWVRARVLELVYYIQSIQER